MSPVPDFEFFIYENDKEMFSHTSSPLFILIVTVRVDDFHYNSQKTQGDHKL